MSALEIGSKAPEFTLPANDGKTISLADYQGKMLVLFFYPKDDTSGCTKESIGFSEMKAEFAAAGAEILGASPNNAKSHDKFRAKYDLTVDLIADEDKTALEAYGVWVEKSMYGKKYMGVERSTFLISGSGEILHIWRKVKVPGHVEEVLAAVQAV